MTKRTIVFLVLNFAALAIGGLATKEGVISDWYNNLNKAPWTPPGWVFAAAWTTIMLCFSVHMAYLWEAFEDKRSLITLYALQWVLNVGWNPIFFSLHQVALALVLIIALTILVTYFQFQFWSRLKAKSLLVTPYFLWLIIATSLNAYILLKN